MTLQRPAEIDPELEADRDERQPVPMEMLIGAKAALIGECVLDRHPTLQGRVRVKWLDGEGEPQECWLPVLRHLSIRERDRVLLLWVENEPHPVVVGVVDGFARRAEPKTEVGAALELKRDEIFRLQGQGGEPLLEIRPGDEGPVVRLLNADTEVELPGKLRIKAAEIELRAERGGVRLEASDDVVIHGEMVRLN